MEKKANRFIVNDVKKANKESTTKIEQKGVNKDAIKFQDEGPDTGTTTVQIIRSVGATLGAYLVGFGYGKFYTQYSGEDYRHTFGLDKGESPNELVGYYESDTLHNERKSGINGVDVDVYVAAAMRIKMDKTDLKLRAIVTIMIQGLIIFLVTIDMFRQGMFMDFEFTKKENDRQVFCPKHRLGTHFVIK